MLKRKALRKIFITTLSMFIILTLYTIPNTNKYDNVLRTNLEIEDITNLSTDSVYLLNKDNYLVKTDVFIDSKDLDDKIRKIINYLTIDNNKVPIGLSGYISKDNKLLDFNIEANSLVLNFSKEFINEEITVSGIVYTMLELDEIEEVSFLVNDKPYKDYNNLNKNIGINKDILYTNRNNIEKVVVYYLDKTDNYYVPVTKYLNNTNEKIEVIVEELKNTKKDLISYINYNAKLLDYMEEANLLVLNFSKEIKDSNKDSLDKTLNTISYSVFDNYDVNMVMFKIEGETYKYIKR